MPDPIGIGAIFDQLSLFVEVGDRYLDGNHGCRSVLGDTKNSSDIVAVDIAGGTKMDRDPFDFGDPCRISDFALG